MQEQTHQVAASLEIIQVLALFTQRYITHAYYIWEKVREKPANFATR